MMPVFNSLRFLFVFLFIQGSVPQKCLQTFMVYGVFEPDEFQRRGTTDPPYYNGRFTRKNVQQYSCDYVALPINKTTLISTPEFCCDDQEFYILQINSLIAQSLPPLSFANAWQFNVIYLNNSAIHNVSSLAFNGLDRLSELYLFNNNISEIMERTFNPLHKLEILDLSCNTIKFINPHCFTGSKYLRILNVSSNLLTSFNGNYIYSILPIKIDLSYNHLSSYSFNDTSNYVSHLNLSHNAISDINGCWSDYKNVRIRYNKLKSLDNITCFNSSTLEYIDLGYNSLSKVPHLEMISLEYLILDHNLVEKLEYGSFDHMPSLLYLDLSYNKLKAIKRYLHALDKLENLNLDANGLNNLNAMQLIKDLPNLHTIHLDKNNFSCEDLIVMFHIFQGRKVLLEPGQIREKVNVQGIECSEASKDSDELKSTFETLLSNKFFSLLGNSSESLKDDLKNSSFYKYLDSLKEHPLKFNENELENYFNRDFKNSSFYQYLVNQTMSSGFNNSFLEYFNEHFRNSSFVKYLQDLKKESQQNFKNIEKQNFYFGDYSSKIEKLLESNQKGTENSGILYFISFLLLIIAIAICILTYKLTFQYISCRKNKYTAENVVLCES